VLDEHTEFDPSNNFLFSLAEDDEITTKLNRSCNMSLNTGNDHVLNLNTNGVLLNGNLKL